MARVLVTAGAGSVGAEVVAKLLEFGHVPIVLDTRTSHQDVRQIFGRANQFDLLQAASEGCDHIFHLEWSGSVHRTTVEPIETNNHNTVATLQVLQMAKSLQIPVTFASTSVYRGDSELPNNETSPHIERSLYVNQKMYAEACHRSFSLLFGVPTCVLRVFNVYGTQGTPQQIIPRIRQALALGTGMQLTVDGGQKRDFIHVSDVAEAFLKTLDHSFYGEIFNVGTGVGTSMKELIELAGRTVGQDIPISYVPAKGEEARYLIADITKAESQLGFKALRRLETELGQLLIN